MSKVTAVSSARDADELAAWLINPSRPFPAVVISSPSNGDPPRIDPEQIATELADLADIWLLTSDDAARALGRGLPDGAAVYNGAARSFPVGGEWILDPRLAPLRRARDAAEGAEATSRVCADVRAIRERQTAPPPAPSPPRSQAPASQDIRQRSSVHTVESMEAARELANWLVSPKRTRPVVVISIAAGQTEPYVDPRAVHDAVAPLAQVFVLPTDRRSWAFADEMPDMLQVYGGASRVYPVGVDWLTNPRSSPLRFARSTRDGERVAEDLVADAIAMAGAAGLVAPPPAADLHSEKATVIGTIPAARALVLTDSGVNGVIRREQIASDLDITAIVSRDMSVLGKLDPVTKVFDVRESLIPPTEALAEYKVGAAVLARVSRVGADSVRLMLFPGVEVRVSRQLLELDEPLEELFTVGEVVAVEILERDPSGTGFRLGVLAEWPETLTAPSLLPGGPPWITRPSEDAAAEPEEADEEDSEPPEAPTATRRSFAAPGAIDSMSMTIDALRAQVRKLTEALERTETDARVAGLELGQLKQNARERDKELRSLRHELERQRTRNRQSAMRKHSAPAPVSLLDAAAGLFSDPERQFRFEVQLAWAERVPATEKENRPLPAYEIGPAFLDSLATVEGIDRKKVAAIVVEVLTADGAQLGQRGAHQLRSSDKGGAPAVRRSDGAVCWRIPLQKESAAARRLHYWRRGDAIELSRIVTHDDTNP